MPHEQVALTGRGITKRFPGVAALSNVGLDVRRGEVHVLVGENGAGKSTLVKILGGSQAPDDGHLELWGQQYRPHSPQDAIRAGVRVVYQEPDLLPELSVAENLYFERLPRRGPVVDYRRLYEKSRGLLGRVGLDVSPRAKVATLSIAQQRLVVIAKALSARARVLILDEPTVSLTRRETEHLFGILRQISDDDTSVVYISHYLDEVFEIGHRVTVLRNGNVVATRPVGELDARQLVRLMVDRDLSAESLFPENVNLGAELLRVEGLQSRAMASPVTFNLREGEILGLAGLVGAGRTEAVRAVFGADRPVSGLTHIAGCQVRIRTPKEAVRNGISFLTEDRRNQGLVVALGSDVNITLADIRSVAIRGVLKKDAERKVATRLVEQLSIKTPSLQSPTRNLSGGNQQKVLLARWLLRSSRILIVDEPTNGLDVGARREIYGLLANLAREGKGIIIVSSDLRELTAICHRILVFSRGQITGELSRAQFEHERLLTLSYQGYFADSSIDPTHKRIPTSRG